jgi:hypothetical protein
MYDPVFPKVACSACCLLHDDFLHGILFDPADGTGIYLDRLSFTGQHGIISQKIHNSS